MKISFIVVCFNYGCYLRQCLDSILGQTGAEFECIVIDNGSTDDTSEILKEYSSSVRAIRQENLGQAGGLNAAWEVATGEWIWTLDADDYLLDGALAAVVPHLKAGLGMVHGEMVTVDDQGRDLPKRLRELRHADEGDLREAVYREGYAFLRPTSANLYPAEAMQKYMPIPQEYFIAADHYLHIRASLAGGVAFVSRPIAAYRLHQNHYGKRSSHFLDIEKFEIKLKFARMTREHLLDAAKGSRWEEVAARDVFRRLDLCWARLACLKAGSDSVELSGLTVSRILSDAFRALFRQRATSLGGRIGRFTLIILLAVTPGLWIRRWTK